MPQRKYLGLQMNRYSFFLSNVLFFFGELAGSKVLWTSALRQFNGCTEAALCRK